MKELLVLQKNAETRTRKINRKHSLLLFLLIAAFVGVIAVGCIMNYVQAADNNREAAEINQQITAISEVNSEKERFLQEENHDEYFEKIAREDYNYGKPGERVFYDSSFGNKN